MLSSSSPPTVVVLAFDRLGSGFLGPYGNAWVRTPHFSQLASESLLCEFVIAESSRLDDIYHGYWTGIPHYARGATADPISLPELARRAGVRPLLITDEERLVHLPLTAGFEEPLLLQSPPPRRAAGELEQTRVFDLLATALAEWSPRDTPDLLWIHAAAMERAWDAPAELAADFCDEDDPAPPALFLPPSLSLPAGVDPDFLVGHVHSYAAQLLACDHALGHFLAQLRQRQLLDNIWLVVTSPRGYPLGEHGHMGSCGDGLLGEVLQTPLLIRAPRAEHRLTRWPGIWQGCDLFTTLASLLGHTGGCGFSLLDGIAGRTPLPQFALAAENQSYAVRTPAWFYRETATDSEISQTLHAKPDDRWEVNEVSRRAAGVTHEFSQWLGQCKTDLHPALRQRLTLPANLLLPSG